MRIVFKNSKLVFAAAKWSAKGKIIKVDSNEVSKVSLPSNAKVYSRNLVDGTKAVPYKILNDSGVEVTDSSSYFNQLIPAVGGSILSTNYAFTRIYYYNEEKELIYRQAFVDKTSVEVLDSYNGQPVAWLTVQTKAGMTEADLNDMIVVMDELVAPTSYESYQSNADGTIYSPYSWVWADDLSEIEITSK